MAPAMWDDESTEVFLQVCAEEVEAHNRLFSCLNTQGKQNLLRKFEERTGYQYTSKQMKNKWEQLSHEYNKWKSLKLRATSLGVDPSTGNIDASDDWWAAAGRGKSEMKKFRAIVDRNEHLLEVVFGNTTITSEYAFVPGVDDRDVNIDDLDDSPAGEGSSMPSPLQTPGSSMPAPLQSHGSGASGRSSGSKRPCPAPLHPSSGRASKHTERDMHLKRMVELSLRSGSHGTGTSVTSPTLNPEREDFVRLMRLVVQVGAHEGSEEHYYATQLFMRLECRHSFACLETSEGRLSWIRRTWERLRDKL